MLTGDGKGSPRWWEATGVRWGEGRTDVGDTRRQAVGGAGSQLRGKSVQYGEGRGGENFLGRGNHKEGTRRRTCQTCMRGS